MSFGVSPGDIVKLLEVSTRVYVAFKDANDNSESQVESLVKEFGTFHHCLVQLDELMKDYGKPLPFPYLDFKETLKRCETTIKPYAANLVDNRKMTPKKFTYTIKYIGKEKEIDNLRKQITGHYQALQMCISFLQLRLHLEATKQTQRLLDSAPFRAMSIGGQMYSSNAVASSARGDSAPIAAPSEADQLYKDWLIFNRWLKSEDDRLARENGSLRPASLGATPLPPPSGDVETAAVLYRLRRELEDAIMIEENRAKRIAMENRTNLAPSDAIRKEVRGMPQIPQRTQTLDSGFSESFSDPGRFSVSDIHSSEMADSVATLRPSPNVSPRGSPRLEQGFFSPTDWDSLSPTTEPSRHSSISTNRSSFSVGSPEHGRLSVSGYSTAGTTPEDKLLHRKYSVSSLATVALGDGALDWTKLSKKVSVERCTSKGSETRECDIHWRYREDHGLSIRSVYRDDRTGKASLWITQHFPATGPSIPLTTSYIDGDVSIDFPRSSFGKLEKRCTDIKYVFRSLDASSKLQTLLYTNNGKDDAELLYDRPILTISSDKNKPECRGKNVRLWRKTEEQDLPNGTVMADVLVLLFYTSALPDDKGHWVEEPHYVFQWLDDSVYNKSSDKLTLGFSKEPGKWSRDKLFRSRKNSSQITAPEAIPDVRASLHRSNTISSVASSAASIRSSKSIFSSPSTSGSLNRFGYSHLDIKFQSKTDRKEFLAIWKKHVKPLGFVD